MMTQHATCRSQKRSIPHFLVDLFELYATEGRHKGADILFMDKKARKRIARDFGGGRALRMLEPLLNSYVVMIDGKVVTVGHRTHRLRR